MDIEGPTNTESNSDAELLWILLSLPKILTSLNIERSWSSIIWLVAGSNFWAEFRRVDHFAHLYPLFDSLVLHVFKNLYYVSISGIEEIDSIK